jgi:TadE-like protein
VVKHVKAARGASAVELLLALPLLLLMGLLTVQFGLLFHAKQGLRLALSEAARAGSTGHADTSVIQAGLARGLVPWLLGASSVADFAVKQVESQISLDSGLAIGWIRLVRLSPTEESFVDWGRIAVDQATGDPIANITEIPNDNLHTYATRMQPSGGATSTRTGALAEAIGPASGQSLIDANTLKLDLSYAVPLNVPLAGSMIAWVMKSLDGCNAATTKSLAALSLGRSPPSTAVAALNSALAFDACAAYNAVDSSGRVRPRLPVRLQSTVMMQSPARKVGGASFYARTQTVGVLASLGAGDMNGLPAGSLGAAPAPNTGFAPDGSPQSVNPIGANLLSPVKAEQSGGLTFGSARELPSASSCR